MNATRSQNIHRGRPLRLLALLLLLALAGLTSACGSESADEPAAAAAPDPARVADGNGFRVTLPDGWRHETLTPEQDLFMGKVIEGTPVTANVIQAPVRSGVTLDEYLAPDRRLDASRRILDEYGVATGDFGDGEKISLGGAEARMFEYPMTASGMRLRVRVVAALRDGVGYVATFGAHSEHFDEQLPQFEAITDSWRWE